MNTQSPQPVTARHSGLRRSSLLAVLGLAAIPAHAVAADGGTLAVLTPFSIAGVALIIGGAAALVLPGLLGGDKAKKAVPADSEPGDGETLLYRGNALRGRRIETRYSDQVAETPAAPAPAAVADPSSPRLEPGKVLERDDASELSAAVAYNASGAARYVGGLTDQVLDRAKIFFNVLATKGEVDSAELARRLEAQPTELAGLLLTSLTRRADAMNAPAPFGIGRVKGTRRRLWLDADKIAANLEHAIERETAKRRGAGAGRNGFHNAPEVKAIADSAR